jgi:1-aminocyclopropane-1-carboxylate deaminase/D-cysteine desulfhydrase-like pyridoxal-dependent ACC family enzyme
VFCDDSVGDDYFVIHYVTTGTFANELKGYEPTGEEQEVEGVRIFRFEGENIAQG